MWKSYFDVCLDVTITRARCWFGNSLRIKRVLKNSFFSINEELRLYKLQIYLLIKRMRILWATTWLKIRWYISVIGNLQTEKVLSTSNKGRGKRLFCTGNDKMFVVEFWLIAVSYTHLHGIQIVRHSDW